MNSYRANGGGQLLTHGAGIPKDKLPQRIVSTTPLDQRHYLMMQIQQMQTISPQPNANWHFAPKKWTDNAIKRDRKLIFGE